MKYVALFVLCVFSLSCRGHVDDYFSANEKTQPIVLKELARDSVSSNHYVLMNGAEKPHYHDHHRVRTYLISGNSRLHVADKVIELRRNESVEIPAGTLHWAENVGPGYSILAAEFSPPFDGKDRRFAE